MSDRQKHDQTEKVISSPSLEKSFGEHPLIVDYKSLSFFLDRTSESIRKTTVMIQQLESEVSRLKYEVMATENEYKNLRHVADELELILNKSVQSSQTNKQTNK